MFAEWIFRHQSFSQTGFSSKTSLKCCLQAFGGIDDIKLIQLLYSFFHIYYNKINMVTYSNEKYKCTPQRTQDNVIKIKHFFLFHYLIHYSRHATKSQVNTVENEKNEVHSVLTTNKL